MGKERISPKKRDSQTSKNPQESGNGTGSKVILLLLDTLRYDAMGFNKDRVETPLLDTLANKEEEVITPHLDKLAEEGVVFDNAYLGSYPCIPARRDVWTGNFEFPFRGWGPLEYGDKDLGRVITRKNEITSMLITDHYHLFEEGADNYHRSFSGYDSIRGQEYDNWIVNTDKPPHNLQTAKQGGHQPKKYLIQNWRNSQCRKTEEDYFPAKVMTEAAKWVERNHNRKDFFLLIDCFDPHEPFDPPQFYRDLYDPDYEGEEITWPTYGKNKLSPRELEHARALYAAELRMTDEWIGYLLRKLDRLQLRDKTTIILTTDHGFMLGEHDLIGKPNSSQSDSNMYRELSHIPLVISHPENKEPKRVRDLVQLVDVNPTIMEAVGIQPLERIHGKSLMPFVLGDNNDRDYHVRDVASYGRFGEAVNVTDGEWTLFMWPPGKKNQPLYWYGQNPPQSRYTHHNLIGDFDVDPEKHKVRWPVECARGEMQTELFNVKEDPQQTHDLSRKKPGIVKDLKHAAVEFLQSVDAPFSQLQRLGLK
jgi:arylsulfatase A-like enzyme